MSADYRQEIQQWRIAKEEELHGDEGWLALAGLFFLHEGANSIGADPSCDIVLPEGSAPGRAATLAFEGGVATLRAEPGVGIAVGGLPVPEAVMQPDSRGTPTAAWIGKQRMIVIERAGRFALRLWDHRTDTRAAFAGREWYAVDEAYNVLGLLVPHAGPRTVRILNVIGDADDITSPGVVTFSLQGRALSLTALGTPAKLRFYLRDLTSGETTYPACRFLNTAASPDGTVIMDFNKAYSPPCAYTPYATCPLPPRENHLPVRIEAGELYMGDLH